MGRIGLIIIVLLMVVVLPVFGEGGKEMQKSDLLHLTVPGGCYIGGAQLLMFCGVDKDVSEWGMLGLGAMCVIGWEYRDYCGAGVCTFEDIQMGLSSLVVGWVVNRGINAVFRPGDGTRTARIRRINTDEEKKDKEWIGKKNYNGL